MVRMTPGYNGNCRIMDLTGRFVFQCPPDASYPIIRGVGTFIECVDEGVYGNTIRTPNYALHLKITNSFEKNTHRFRPGRVFIHELTNKQLGMLAELIKLNDECAPPKTELVSELDAIRYFQRELKSTDRFYKNPFLPEYMNFLRIALLFNRNGMPDDDTPVSLTNLRNKAKRKSTTRYPVPQQHEQPELAFLDFFFSIES